MTIDRRTAVLAGLGLSGAAATEARAAGADFLSGRALYADVKTYSDLGEHRTGTFGDSATTVWLERTLRAAGYVVERQGFDYPVFEVGRTELSLGAGPIEGFPYWTPRATPPSGITGLLSLTGGPGTIALVALPPGSGAGLNAPPPSQIVQAVASGAAAIVAVTQNPLGEIAALNRTPKAEAWPVPVLLVAGRELAALTAAATAGKATTLVLEGRTVIRRAENVIGRRPRPGKHLVISTPKSGWFHCAGERGSGLAIWLGLARELAATTQHNLTVVAASGHEFDGYGGHVFTEQLAPKPADTKLWLHIGASVAVYAFGLKDGRIVRLSGPPNERILTASTPLIPQAQKLFAGQPGYQSPTPIEGSKPPGEVALFATLGYAPLIGMVGASQLHHTRRDLIDVTDATVLEPVARGLMALVRSA